MVEKRVLGVGKYADPEDTQKPYWVSLEWFEGKPGLQQPVSESEFLTLMNRIFEKTRVILEVEVTS